MTPAIEPMAPGERPTEPGWYTVKDRRGSIDMLEVLPFGPNDKLVGYHSGNWQAQRLDCFTFIARIFPDRIEGRER